MLGVTNPVALIFQPTKKMSTSKLQLQWNDWPPGRPVAACLGVESKRTTQGAWVDQVALSAGKRKPKGCAARPRLSSQVRNSIERELLITSR